MPLTAGDMNSACLTQAQRRNTAEIQSIGRAQIILSRKADAVQNVHDTKRSKSVVVELLEIITIEMSDVRGALAQRHAKAIRLMLLLAQNNSVGTVHIEAKMGLDQEL